MSNRVKKRDFRIGREHLESGLRGLRLREEEHSGDSPSWELQYGIGVLRERLLAARGRDAVMKAAQAAWNDPPPKFSRDGT